MQPAAANLIDAASDGVGMIVIGNVEHLDHAGVLEHRATVVQGFVAAELGIVQSGGGYGIQNLFQRLVAKEPYRFGTFAVAIPDPIGDQAGGSGLDAAPAAGDENHTEVVGASLGCDQGMLEAADAADLDGGVFHGRRLKPERARR